MSGNKFHFRLRSKQSRHDGKSAIHWAAILEDTAQLASLTSSPTKRNPNVQDKYGRTVLHWAAVTRGVDSVKHLLNVREIDPNLQDGDGRTPLHEATIRGFEDVVEALLTHRTIDSDIQDLHGRTALHWACEYGHSSIVQLLLDHGAAPSAADKADRNTALHRAAYRNNTHAVSYLLKHDKALARDQNNEGNTPLHLALCTNKSIDTERFSVTCERLIQALDSSFINTANSRGETVLHYEARGGGRFVQDLLDKGADIDSKDRDGRTAVVVALEAGNRSALQVFLGAFIKPDLRVWGDYNPPQRTVGELALLWAAAMGHLGTVESLLDRGKADPTLTSTRDGRTAMWLAAAEGHVQIVQLLLDSKTDPTQPDSYGVTPLVMALEKSHRAVFDLLLDNPEVQGSLDDHNGTDALCIAAKSGDACVVRQLLAYGAVPHPEEEAAKVTPLLEAVEGMHMSVVDALLERLSPEEISFAAGDSSGKTALWLATNTARADIAEKLLSHGAEGDAKALHLAAERGDVDVLKVMIKSGKFNLDSRERYSGQTPLFRAVEVGQRQVVRMLLETGQVNILAPDCDEETPLRHALDRGDVNTLKIMVEVGNVNIHQEIGFGQTVLHRAIQAGHLDSFKMLLANINQEEPIEGREVLSAAISLGREEMLKILLDTANIDPFIAGPPGEGYIDNQKLLRTVQLFYDRGGRWPQDDGTISIEDWLASHR